MNRVVLALALLAAAVPAAAKNLYIPAAGSAPGLGGTHFRTDVRIFNPSSSETIYVTLHLLPQGMDGSNISGRVVTLAPRQMAVLNDVVAGFLQWPVPAIGAIRLDSDTDRSYEFSADSRTYTDSPHAEAPGTYGQFIPALDPDTAATKTGVVLHVSNNTAFRTNAGVMNHNREAVTVRAKLMRADGTLDAESAPFLVPPMSMTLRSVSQFFGEDRIVDDGYFVLESTLPVFTFASVVDNDSGDAIFVNGVADLVE